MATRKTPPDATAPVSLEPGISDQAARWGAPPPPPPDVTDPSRVIIVNGFTYETDLSGTLIGRSDVAGVWRDGVDPADAPALALHGYPAVVFYDLGAGE